MSGSRRCEMALADPRAHRASTAMRPCRPAHGKDRGHSTGLNEARRSIHPLAPDIPDFSGLRLLVLRRRTPTAITCAASGHDELESKPRRHW